MLGLAHRVGWTPQQFWAATPYELETILREQVAMASPPKPTPMKPKQLGQMLRTMAANGRGGRRG